MIVGSFAFLAIYTRRGILKNIDHLRDIYSHDLGNNLQAIHFATEIIARTEQTPEVSKAIVLIKKIDRSWGFDNRN